MRDREEEREMRALNRETRKSRKGDEAFGFGLVRRQLTRQINVSTRQFPNQKPQIWEGWAG